MANLSEPLLKLLNLTPVAAARAEAAGTGTDSAVEGAGPCDRPWPCRAQVELHQPRPLLPQAQWVTRPWPLLTHQERRRSFAAEAWGSFLHGVAPLWGC